MAALNHEHDKDEKRPFIPFQTVAAAVATTIAPTIDPPVMQRYYRKAYPCEEIFQWLTQPKLKREWAFRLADGDVVIRHKTMQSPTELRNYLCSPNPTDRLSVVNQIDIGALYDSSSLSKTEYTKPLQKEIVMDIDLDVYDDVRLCGCKGGDQICLQCWQLVVCAARALHFILIERFGFKESDMLWVYSGRRGLHVWIMNCRELDNTARQTLFDNIAGYGNSYQNWAAQQKLRSQAYIHSPSSSSSSSPFIKTFHPNDTAVIEKVLEPQFVAIYIRQWRLFADDVVFDRFLRCFKPSVYDKFKDLVGYKDIPSKNDPEQTSLLRWNRLKLRIQQTKMTAPQLTADLEPVLHRLICAYAYPRLDAEVTRQMGHLTKAPFCVHPKTGRIAVPVDVPSKLDSFDPFQSLTLQQWSDSKKPDMLLKPYLMLFKKKVGSL
jgi:DNA primase small subunit